MRKLLEEFVRRPLSELTFERLQSLYEVLFNYQFENEESISQDENDCLTHTLDLIQKELDRQYVTTDMSLTDLLIDNPAHVEAVLSELSLLELFEVAKRGAEIKSPLLRQQFANMIERCMEDWAYETTATC